MPIVGCFVFPHGAITLDPASRDFVGIPAVKPTSKEECIKLHEAIKANAESLVDTKPDLIVLSTPHGLRLKDSFLFLGNVKMKGNAEWDKEWTDFDAEFNIDCESSECLVNYLEDAGHSVEILTLGDPTNDPLPLKWSEVIPWWFISNAAEKVSFQLPPVVFIGQPSQRYTDTEKMIPELLKFGEDIFHWTQSDDKVSRKKIAIVISSDLSHFHSADPTSPYQYSEFASVFDAYVCEWAEIHISPATERESYEKLVTMAGALVNRIGSCGYTGLVTLYGILRKCCEDGSTFEAKLFYYSVPTYYGMMANNFIPFN